MSIHDVQLIDLPTIPDLRGCLSFVEGLRDVPFEIKRVYFIYGVPGNTVRGGHAHKQLRQLIIALGGSFEITLDDGVNPKQSHLLSTSSKGLLLPNMIWRELFNFSVGASCLVLASDIYLEDDYYRSYTDFLAGVGASN